MPALRAKLECLNRRALGSSTSPRDHRLASGARSPLEWRGAETHFRNSRSTMTSLDARRRGGDLRLGSPDRAQFRGLRPLLCAGLAAVMLVLAVVFSVSAQAAGPAIASPTPNQALQGEVTITGSTGAANFASGELAFAYTGDSANTWFLIQSISQPVIDGTLATWDTSKISDGSYVLRLRVFASDGTFQDALVDLEVANYTSPEVASPVPSATMPPSVLVPSPMVIPTSKAAEPSPVPTPTALAANPMSLPTSSIYAGLAGGAVVAVVVIVALALIMLRRQS